MTPLSPLHHDPSLPHRPGQFRVLQAGERDDLLHCQLELQAVEGVGDAQLLFQFRITDVLGYKDSKKQY